MYDDIVMRNSVTAAKSAANKDATASSITSVGNGAKSKKPKRKTPKDATHQSGKAVEQSANQQDPPIKLYCICRTADENAQMISCDKCEEWYHFECVGLDIVPFFR